MFNLQTFAPAPPPSPQTSQGTGERATGWGSEACVLASEPGRARHPGIRAVGSMRPEMTPASRLPPPPAAGPLALRPQQLSARKGDRGRPEVTSQPTPLPLLGPGPELIPAVVSHCQALFQSQQWAPPSSPGHLPTVLHSC